MVIPLIAQPREDAAARAPDFDSAHFKSALAQFATGVTIITTRAIDARGEPHLVGFTASSFNSVSLDPPLVLWSLSRVAGSLAVFRDNTHYAVNVLASDQIELSRRFGSRGDQLELDQGVALDRFEGIALRAGFRGAPVLEGCCAWFECFNRSRYEEGDHVIFVGEVERCGRREGAQPLIFHGGRYFTELPLLG